MYFLKFNTKIYDNVVFAIPFVIFAILHIFRPLNTGIYHDDWFHLYAPLLMSPLELDHFLLYEIGGRPLYAFALFLIYKYWNGNIPFLTIMMSIIVGITAISLYFFIKKLFDNENNNKKISSLCVSIWISIPWGLGYSLWPTACITLIGLSFFLWSQFYAIDYFQTGKKYKLIIISVLMILSFAMYQAMYLSFISTILYLYAKNDINSKSNIKRLIEIAIISIIIQIIFVYISKQYSGKTIDSNILLMITNILYHFPKAIIATFGIFIFLPLIVIYYIFKENKAQILNDKKIIIIFLISIFVSMHLFTFAGYAISGIGVFSRTTMGINIWIVVFIGRIILNIVNKTEEDGKIEQLFNKLFIFIMILTAATINQTLYWQKSWKRQNEILNSIPYVELLKLPDKSIVILNEPLDLNGITVFGASWDITSAIYARNEMSEIRHYKYRPLFVPFNNRIIRENDDGLMIDNIYYKEEYVWVYNTNNETINNYKDGRDLLWKLSE